MSIFRAYENIWISMKKKFADEIAQRVRECQMLTDEFKFHQQH